MSPNELANGLGKQMQVAWVVHDMQAALEFMVRRGIGPFIVFKNAITDDRVFIHRGKPSPVQMSLALSYCGDTQIEVICPTNDAPSPYKEFLDAGQQGLHHVGFWPEDYIQACTTLEQDGCEELCAVYTNGIKNVSYYSGPKTIGSIIELVPLVPQRKMYFDAVQRLSQNWDGSRPIRWFDTRAAFLDSPDYREVFVR